MYHRVTGVLDRSRDAFGRDRVSNPLTLVEIQHQYNTQPLLWDDTTVTGGTIVHLPNESSVRLRTTTSDGSSVTRESKEHVRYQPGKSQLVVATAVMGAAKAGVRQRIGLFNANNGLFFEQTETGIRIVRRTFTSGSIVDVAVEQASWNMDKMNGTGNSRINLDTSLAQIFVIDFQWLGVGRIRYGFDTGAGVVYCHEDPNANELSEVYMTTANLPVRYEITNTAGTASNTDVKQVCATVISEGGFERQGFPFSANNGVTAVSVTGVVPILSIRPKATFNSITNTALILPIGFSMYSAGNIFYEVVHGGSPTDDSWTSANADSVVEFDVAATALTGGRVVNSGYIAAGGGGESGQTSGKGFLSRLPLTGTDILTIRATSLSGTNNTYASLNWLETY